MTSNRRETTRPKRFLLACLMIASVGAGVASCATTAGSFPPALDVRVQSKPIPPDGLVISRVAGEMHDNEVEAWGEDGGAQDARLCRFFAGIGDEGAVLHGAS